MMGRTPDLTELEEFLMARYVRDQTALQQASNDERYVKNFNKTIKYLISVYLDICCRAIRKT